jgi:hypothetical protein
MCFTVHVLNYLWILSLHSHRVNHLFSTFEIFWANTKCNLSVLCSVWPIVVSGKTLTQWFSYVWSVLSFFNVIKFVLHAKELASFHHSVDVLGSVAALSIGIGWWEMSLVICHTMMFLNLTWLVNMRFPKLFEVLWCPWHIHVNILSNTIISRFTTSSLDHKACSSNFRDGVRSGSFVLFVSS